ncbi:unnamed protein product [Xylocopa violacea]|uniref:Transmembrane protein n=1 Tax=Xylocopa violacea TaxID=135666 RepID=A0ABP1N077_XYLVO
MDSVDYILLLLYRVRRSRVGTLVSARIQLHLPRYSPLFSHFIRFLLFVLRGSSPFFPFDPFLSSVRFVLFFLLFFFFNRSAVSRTKQRFFSIPSTKREFRDQRLRQQHHGHVDSIKQRGRRLILSWTAARGAGGSFARASQAGFSPWEGHKACCDHFCDGPFRRSSLVDRLEVADRVF